MGGATEHWGEAEANADVGFGSGGRFALVRRTFGRLLWPFLRHQVVVNRSVLAELDALARRLEVAEFELERARGDIEHHTEVLVRHEEPLDRHEFLLKHLEPAFLDLQRAVDLVHDKVDLGQRQAFARYYEGIGSVRGALGELTQRLEDVEREASERRGGWHDALSDVWLRLSQLDLYLTEARRAFPEAPTAERLAQIPNGFASLYSVFEEAFRGPVPVVEERVRAYVEDLTGLPAGAPVLDLGSGRGELLAVLGEAGVVAYGVDTDRDAAARARSLGLDVRTEDAREHLAGLEAKSLGAVTAIQFVEHVATDELIEILELAARALRPGGLLILESPNPENLVVASSSFYLDPSRRRPVPPALLEFLVGSRGFDEVVVRRLERAEQAPGLARPKPEEPWSDSVGAIVDAVNFHLFGPADYAVLARRP